MFDPIDFPWCFIGFIILLCGLTHIMTKILCEKEVLIEQNYIGLNIKETEGDLPVTDRFKLERHLHPLKSFMDASLYRK
jgi:hypothetical protein